MEQTMNVNQKYGKEVGYNENRHDYVADGEIMITITLAEYRELVKNLATKEAELSHANSDLASKELEICNLKIKIERLLKESDSGYEQADSF